MGNFQTTVQNAVVETDVKDLGSDTNSSDKLSVAQGHKRETGRGKRRALNVRDLSAQTIASFQRKIKKTESCWLWQGTKERHGYGQAYCGTRPDGFKDRIYAHRIAYALAFGNIPADLVVMHTCDNPPCVNPAHLKLATQAENIADRDAKGRARKTSPRIRKISEAGVIEIRLTKDYIPSSFYAKQWNVCVSHINRIRRGEKRKVS